MQAFGHGDYARAVALLRAGAQRGAPLRRQPRAARPDRPDLIEAAARSGDQPLAAALAAERLALKPRSPLAQRMQQRWSANR